MARVTTRVAAGPASGAGLTDDILAEKLGALGGTSFALRRLDTTALEPGLHVPVSELKAARRALVAELQAEPRAGASPQVESETRSTSRASLAERPRFALPSLAPPDLEPRIVPLCRSPEQLEAAIDAGLDEVELDWMELVGLGRAVERARSAGLRVILATLRIQKPGEEPFDGRLAQLEPDGVLVRHWGGLVAFARRRAESPESFARLRIPADSRLQGSAATAEPRIRDACRSGG